MRNIATLLSKDYDDGIIFLHEHGKYVAKTHAKLLAIEDEPAPNSQRVDLTRQDYRGLSIAPLQNLIDLPRHLLGHVRPVEKHAFPFCVYYIFN